MCLVWNKVNPSLWIDSRQSQWTRAKTIFKIPQYLRDLVKNAGAMRYYLINYKYLAFATYRLILTFKKQTNYQESLFEMSAINNFGVWRRIILIDPKHLAQRKQRHFFGKHFNEIDHRALSFHVVEQLVDLQSDSISDLANIGREEKIVLLHTHFTM